jgi:hypothetical protein
MNRLLRRRRIRWVCCVLAGASLPALGSISCRDLLAIIGQSFF